MIWIQNQLVGAAIGQNITLECQSEAFPKSINYWMKNDTIIVPGEYGRKHFSIHIHGYASHHHLYSYINILAYEMKIIEKKFSMRIKYPLLEDKFFLNCGKDVLIKIP